MRACYRYTKILPVIRRLVISEGIEPPWEACHTSELAFVLRDRNGKWWKRRDFNPQLSACKADTLAIELLPLEKMTGVLPLDDRPVS